MAIPKDVIDFASEHGLNTTSAAQSNVRTAAVAALYGLVLAGAFVLDSAVVWVAAWVVLGALMLSCYAAMHEALHGHLYASRRANRVAGFLWGAAVLTDFSSYRAFHLQHHSHTRVDGDPEPHEDFASAGQYLFFTPLIGIMFWGQLAAASVATMLGRAPAWVRNDRQRRAIVVDGLLVLALGLGVAFSLWQWPGIVLRAWAVPFAISTVVVSMVTLPEHYGCDQVPDYLRSTRSTLSNPVMRFLFWNNNFHAAHHVYPAVPYHRYSELHEYTVGRTAHVAPSYTSFHAGLLRSLARRRSTERAEPVPHP